MRLVCFPVVSAASSGLGLSGSVDVLGFTEEEPAAGGGVVLGASCAIAGNVSAIARKTARYPYRAKRAYLVGRLCDGSGIGVVRCDDESWEPDTGVTDSDGHSWGIRLSRGKFHAPEREKYKRYRLRVGVLTIRRTLWRMDARYIIYFSMLSRR